MSEGQRAVGAGVVGGVCGVCAFSTEHRPLSALSHPLRNARHAGLQRSRQRVFHGTAQR